jgi:hypothetical protein
MDVVASQGRGPASSTRLHGPVAVAVDVLGTVDFLDCGFYTVGTLESSNECDYSVVRAISPSPLSANSQSLPPQGTGRRRCGKLERRPRFRRRPGVGDKCQTNGRRGWPSTGRNLYIADTGNHAVRARVDALTGVITTVAGARCQVQAV